MDYKINGRDILYFTDGPFRDYGSNLKVFTDFLKISGITGPLKFSYTGSDTSLIHDLTIEENILLSININMKDVKDRGYLEQYVKTLNNPFLQELCTDLKASCDLNMLPSQVTNYTAKKALIIKALLQPCDYVILEHNNIDLKEETLDVLQKALIFLLNSEDKIALIADRHQSKWNNIATKYVSFEQGAKKSFTMVESQQWPSPAPAQGPGIVYPLADDQKKIAS